MNITVQVDEATLDTIVREESEYSREVTVADLVAEKLAQRVINDQDAWRSFRDVVTEIRDDEIRAAVRPLIAEALSKPRQQTNAFGEPTGPETTLSDVIVAEARKMLTQPGRYEQQTAVQKIVADEVRTAFQKVITDEVATARDMVSEQIGALVAQAVKNGIRKS